VCNESFLEAAEKYALAYLPCGDSSNNGAAWFGTDLISG